MGHPTIALIVLGVYYPIVFGGTFASSFPTAVKHGVGWIPVFWTPFCFIASELEHKDK